MELKKTPAGVFFQFVKQVPQSATAAAKFT